MQIVIGAAARPAVQMMSAMSIKALRNVVEKTAGEFTDRDFEPSAPPFSVFDFRGRLVRVDYDFKHDAAEIVSIS